DVERVSAYNPSAGHRLSNALTPVDARLIAFDDLLHSSYVEDRSGSANEQDALDAAGDVVKDLSEFSKQSVNALDTLLSDRLDRHIRRRTQVFLTEAVFLCLALYAFAGFYTSTNRTVRSLVSAGQAVRTACATVRTVAVEPEAGPMQVQTEPVVIETHDELRELGQMMVDLINDLSRAVEDYSRSQQAMYSAKQEAEHANMAKSEFLGRMSHELRTPLNSIMGFSQLLQLQELSEEQLESAQLIYRSGKHLLSLINEVLDLARIESGDLAISLESVQIAPLIREAIGIVKPLADGRGIGIRFEPEPSDELCVSADNRRLLQVCLNLLSNAVKYNVDQGSVAVGVTRSGDRVRVSVDDTGIGIDESKLANLFSPFDRLGREGSEVEGTGLGLSVSKGLVETMGGELSYARNQPSGSVFSFELKLAEFPGTAVAASGVLTGIESATWDRSKRILVIEDNVANVELLRSVFKLRPQVSMIVAMKGRLGVELAQENPPDLVVLDLNLPDISGFEVYSELRSHPSTANVPVLVLTADATHAKSEHASLKGILAYLTKPLDVERLVNLLDQELGKSRDAG
ncbi:MAG TPA: ATP-binding protein, partial [Fimbriimonadaceae bacterium]|nr:ATP-binding protein [Fimbriimonadaceae bacterium]